MTMKIIASVLVKRLKSVLKSQCGFLSGRHISNNIRLVIDLVNYKDLLDGSPSVLFLDFDKAFDTVSHNFIFNTLNFFKFDHYL